LTNSSGTPITAATSVVFAIYSAASGGTALWTETISSLTPDAQGVFTQELGLSTALPAGLFAGAKRYLGIKVGADAEMTPRQIISSGPYAISTTNIPDNSVTSAKVSNGSLTNVDILDEPGIAQAKSTSSVTVANTGVTSIISRQITTPGAGYVVAYGFGYASVGSSTGTTMGNVIVGIDTLATSYGQDYIAFGAGGMSVASNLFWWGSVANSRVFYFSGAVTKTFYMNAGRGYADGIAYIFLPKIQLVFYPTSYGTVTSTVSTAEAAQFDEAADVIIGGGSSGAPQTNDGYKNVDLRELELKALRTAAQAEKAQRELEEARTRQQNDEQE
jgi:hypothetical protein